MCVSASLPCLCSSARYCVSSVGNMSKFDMVMKVLMAATLMLMLSMRWWLILSTPLASCFIAFVEGKAFLSLD